MKKHLLSLVLALACMLSLMPMPVSAESTEEEEFLSISISGTQDYDEILEAYQLINQVREANGIPKLTLDPLLTENAMQRAAEISVYYSYTRPNGWHYLSGIDLRYDILGFKAHAISFGDPDALSVVRNWMTSDTLLFSETYTTIGIGCFYQDDGEKYWALYLTDKTIYSQFEESGKKYVSNIPIEIIPENIDIRLADVEEIDSFHTYEGESVSFQVQVGRAVIDSGYTLSVEDDTIVQVDSQNNTLTGLKGGDTSLTVHIGEVSRSLPVSVTGIPEALYLNFGMQEPDDYVLIWPDDQIDACLFGKKTGTDTWNLLSHTKSGFNMYAHLDIPVGEEWTYILRLPWANGTYLDISNEVLLVKLSAPILSVVGDQQGGLNKLIWEAQPGETSYEIYRGTDPDGPYPYLATVTETSYLDTAAESGQTYYYRICALGKGQSRSPFSNIVSRTSGVDPINLKVRNVASSGKPKLTWDKVEDAVKYEVYRATSKTGTYKRLSTTANTSLTNTSTEAGETYYYKVRAVLSDGSKTKFSSIVSRTCDLPRPEVRRYHNLSTGKIVLMWDAITDAVKYEVYRSTDNKTWTKLNTTTDTLISDVYSEPGTMHYYKVKAIHEKSAANSAYSTVCSLICRLSAPQVTVSNVASTGKIKLSWAKIEGAVGYEVYRATSSEGAFTLLKTTTGTSLTNTSAKAGETYYYTVLAVHENAAANSSLSNTVSRTCRLPRPEVTLTNIASTGKIKIKWGAVEGAVKYELYCSTDNENWTKLTTTTGTSINHNSGVAGTRYYYKVKAIASNTAANSAYSAVKNGYCDLARPTLTVKLNSSGKPVLTWTKIEGTVKYEIYRSTDNKTWTKLSTVSGTKLTNTSAVSGTTYYYKVRAIASNTAANSAYSTVKSIAAK